MKGENQNMELYLCIEKRRKAKEEFYLKALGALIKKHRLKMNMSQLELAIGICSNTYISKLENNHALPGWEQLMLLMERVNLNPSDVSFPREALDYLEKAMDCFYRCDGEGYRSIINEIDKYEFTILLELTRFGYYVMIEDYETARDYYNNLFRYLSSLEDYGFAVFLLFACFYNHGVGEVEQARSILEIASKRLMMTNQIRVMFAFADVLIYKNIRMYEKMFGGYQTCITDFTQTFNTTRLMQLMVIRKMLKIDEGTFKESMVDDRDLDYLMPVSKAKYLLKLASFSKTPEKYLKKIDKDNPYRGLALCKLAGVYNDEDQETFDETIAELKSYQIEHESTIDFVRMIELAQDKHSMEYKEFLAKHVLPKAVDSGDVDAIEQVIESIIDILRHNSRYKDALSYRKKFKKICHTFRTRKKGTWKE